MMAASGQGASPTSYPNASIIDVLLAYGARGGALLAAYRHPDNPLLLTHTRWQGQGGELIEAHRSPDDMSMVREEREAWARVALLSTTLRPDSVGPNAPWLRAPLDPREAYELATRAQRARDASAPPIFHPSPVHSSSGPARTPSYAPPTPSGFGAVSAPGYLPPSYSGMSGMSDAGASASSPFEPYGGYVNARVVSEAPQPQNTGGWPREAFQPPQPQQPPHHPAFHHPSPPPGRPMFDRPPSQPNQEIIVAVCIEIEISHLMTSPAEDFTRDFARDVALTFNRAARTIPQTRETRGWMNGDHMTLGALMALGTGARPASRAEMEHAADTLAGALAQRTLPYVRLRFADTAEWEQGVPLPE